MSRSYILIVIVMLSIIFVGCGEVKEKLEVIETESNIIKAEPIAIVEEPTVFTETVIVTDLDPLAPTELSAERRDELIFDLKCSVLKIDETIDTLIEHGINPNSKYETSKVELLDRLEELRQDIINQIADLENT